MGMRSRAPQTIFTSNTHTISEFAVNGQVRSRQEVANVTGYCFKLNGLWAAFSFRQFWSLCHVKNTRAHSIMVGPFAVRLWLRCVQNGNSTHFTSWMIKWCLIIRTHNAFSWLCLVSVVKHKQRRNTQRSRSQRRQVERGRGHKEVTNELSQKWNGKKISSLKSKCWILRQQNRNENIYFYSHTSATCDSRLIVGLTITRLYVCWVVYVCQDWLTDWIESIAPVCAYFIHLFIFIPCAK